MSEENTETTESTEATSTEAEPESTTEQEPAGAEALGDAGKKALDSMKAERNRYRDDLKALRSEFDSFKAKAEGKEAEHQQALEAQKVRDEAIAKANDRILRSEIKAAAKGSLADPADAYRYLDLESFEVDDNGNVDESQISKAIEDLVSERPYLAAQGSKRFQGSADGGARNGNQKPTQLTQADLKSMTHEQIQKAREDGQLADLMGTK